MAANEPYRGIFSAFTSLPFLFLGSGISMRYLGLPNWEGLLRHFAHEVYPGNPLALEVFSSPEEGLDWPTVATRLEREYNQIWLRDDRYQKARKEFQEQVKNNISPFKLAVAAFIKAAEKQRENHLLDELSCLTNAGKRSIAGVITTNYDLLTEQIFGGYTTFIGQENLLFAETQDILEIYKIHGCCSDPASIVINAKDYEDFNDRNAYLAAKLLTIFVEHPIVFLGYSISDPDIQSILRAIAGCLSQKNLERLKNRMIFVEYSETPLDIAEIQSHSVTFDGSRSLEMTRIKLHDFLPLYSELLSRKYHYNPKLLRQLKRDIYQLAACNEPSGERFRIADIEDDDALNHIDVVVGIGVDKKTPAEEAGGTGGHHIPSQAALFRDIVFDDGGFDLRSLVEEALAVQLKRYSYSLPLHKYLSQYERTFQKEAPAEVSTYAKHSFDGFLNDQYRKKRKHKTYSFDEILKMADNKERILEFIPLVDENTLKEHDLEIFLKNYLGEHPDCLKEGSTNLRRIIKMYDWLKYGKSKGAPTT